jgi:PD-(D/E)XK nuclease superfamily
MTTATVVPMSSRHRDPISISQVRTAVMCGRAYQLIYLDGRKRRLSASALYGSVAHELFRYLYRGEAQDDALVSAWRTYCTPLLSPLAQWHALDEEYRKVGTATSNVAKAWRTDHPAYDRLLEQIQRYQVEHMGQYRWGDALLAKFYRRSMRLLSAPLDRMLLPHPLLVEGLSIQELSADPPEVDTDELDIDELLLEGEEKGRNYKPLYGYLGGDIPIFGVPDIIAEIREEVPDVELDDEVDESKGKVLGYRIADVKTGRETLENDLPFDAQLLLSYHLAIQNAVVDPNLPVEIGHIYLPENGIPRQVWVDTSHYEEAMPEIEKAFAELVWRKEHNAFFAVQGIPTASLSPCQWCDVAHICKSEFRKRPISLAS